MGFFSRIKRIFISEKFDDAALEAARVRHGIKADAETKASGKPATEAERFAKNFDLWEEVRNWNSNYFLGHWVTRKFHPVGEDKVKKQLADLEKKRRATAEKEKEQGS